jgi:hypothetical protein
MQLLARDSFRENAPTSARNGRERLSLASLAFEFFSSAKTFLKHPR